MKRIITFLLCLNIVLSAAACAKVDRPDDIDSESLPSASESEPKPNDPEEELYNNAVSLLESGDLYGAYDIFLTIPHVKDAGEYLSRFSFGYAQYDYERLDDDYKHTVYVEYDEYGRRVFSKTIYSDGIEHTYGYVYDDNGNLIEELKNGVIYHIYKYDEAGNPIKMIPADGYASELEYDENGNITKIILPDGTITEKKYDENGNVLEAKTTLGRHDLQTRYYEYNAHGDLISNTLWEAGKVVSVKENEWEYNDAGKPLRLVIIKDGKVSSRYEYSYHESGSLKEELYFSDNYTHKYEYDERGNKIVSSSCWVGEDDITFYIEYDENGNMIKYTREENNNITYAYFEYDKYGNELSGVYTIDNTKHSYSGYKLYYNPSPSKPLPEEFTGKG